MPADITKHIKVSGVTDKKPQFGKNMHLADPV